MFIFRRLFSIFISMFLFVSVASTPGEKYEPADSDKIKLSAVVLSDIHMQANETDCWNRLGNTLQNVYQTSKTPDVLAFAGDNTMSGLPAEWFDFYGFVNRFAKDSKVLVSFGNHDFGNTDDHNTYKKLSKRCIDSYNGYCKESIDKVYYSTEVNGYKFIVLGSEDNAENTISVISDEQIEWLKLQLKEAADKKFPAFVINHNLVKGKNGTFSTYYKNYCDNSEALANALEGCGTKVVYISGHSHQPVWRGSYDTFFNVTYVNLPCAGTTGTIWNHSSDNDYGTGLCIEVYENYMLLRFRCFGESKWVENFDSIKIKL